MCLRTRPCSCFRFVARRWKKKRGAWHSATGPKSCRAGEIYVILTSQCCATAWDRRVYCGPKEDDREDSRVEETSSVDRRKNCSGDCREARKDEARLEGGRDFRLRREVIIWGVGGRQVEDFKGREKATKWWSDMGSRVTERTEVQQDLVKTRLSWFPALWVGGEGESVGSNVEKKCVKSDECNFSG